MSADLEPVAQTATQPALDAVLLPYQQAWVADRSAVIFIAAADIGNNCYVVDDQTVAKTNGTNSRSVAGKVHDVDAIGVWVDFR